MKLRLRHSRCHLLSWSISERKAQHQNMQVWHKTGKKYNLLYKASLVVTPYCKLNCHNMQWIYMVASPTNSHPHTSTSYPLQITPYLFRPGLPLLLYQLSEALLSELFACLARFPESPQVHLEPCIRGTCAGGYDKAGRGGVVSRGLKIETDWPQFFFYELN